VILKNCLNVQKCQFMLTGTQSFAKMADVRIHINNKLLKHVLVATYMTIIVASHANVC